MFCEKCGNQLPDTADFCPKCGNEFDSQVNIINNVRNNNEVLLEVRPTFKFSYIVLPKLLKELIVLGIAISISIFSLLELNDLSIYIKNNKKHKVLFAIIALCLMIIGFALVPIIFSKIFLKDLIIFNLLLNVNNN